ncbi:hypothetical protein BOX15_Mlig029598g3 [Macrostomum lignano]|uniref:Uncharacterized protein n=1 Tax=Macrostomum lignano TaxID=282301 RepID=A0A267E3Y4_9PLAT|nr:hypothetical protein BOX15_Mlig029598g3 [Macrostomum lignano]
MNSEPYSSLTKLFLLILLLVHHQAAPANGRYLPDYAEDSEIHDADSTLQEEDEKSLNDRPLQSALYEYLRRHLGGSRDLRPRLID